MPTVPADLDLDALAEYLRGAAALAAVAADQRTQVVVEGAAAYAAVRDTPPARSPTLYVVPLRDDDEPPRTLGPTARAQTTATFGVLYAVRGLRDARGAAQQDALRPWRAAVRAALAAHVPPGCLRECQRRGGALLHVGGGWLWWQDAFTTAYDYHYARPLGG